MDVNEGVPASTGYQFPATSFEVEPTPKKGICKEGTFVWHVCPYDEDVHGELNYCFCCKDCTQACANDI